MDVQRQQDLWAIALEHYQAARLTAQQGWHNVSVACSYYAVFMAMWVALGDPPRGHWEHGGIVDWFARGDWRTPPAMLERELIRAIRRMYTDRSRATYGAVHLYPFESVARLATARRVLQIIANALGLSQGGIIP
jgi:uncharacterized protein (UPF0332 family)